MILKAIFNEMLLLFQDSTAHKSPFEELPSIIAPYFEDDHEVCISIRVNGLLYETSRIDERSKVCFAFNSNDDSILFTYSNDQRPNVADLALMQDVVVMLRGLYLMLVNIQVQQIKSNVLDDHFSIVILDQHRRVQYVNSRFAAKVKAYTDECVGKVFDEFVERDDCFRFTSAFDTALSGDIQELMLRMADGTKILRNVYFELRPYREKNNFNGVILMAKEISTNRKVGVILEDSGLSPSELKIANMIKEGVSIKEIAQREFISRDTVKWHCKQIRKKLGITNSGSTLRSFLKKLT